MPKCKKCILFNFDRCAFYSGKTLCHLILFFYLAEVLTSNCHYDSKVNSDIVIDFKGNRCGFI